MRKLLLLIAFGFLLITSCHKYHPENNVSEMDEPTATERKCAAYDVLEEQLKADPLLQQRMDQIEEFTRRVQANPENLRLLSDGTTLEVPVQVNVLYRTAAEDISQDQIDSQIKILNDDFAGTNADVNKTSTYDSEKVGNTKITFVWRGTKKQATTKTSWSTNDAMKKSSQGGIDPTDPATTLNIWVCTLSNGILGYAQFPGGGSLSTDGVVILNTAFGNTGTARAPFNKGRTATHEVGHYFNLRHIWGDRRCGDDLVADTPEHDGANYGCPAANTKKQMPQQKN